jgi:hypothetical protein
LALHSPSQHISPPGIYDGEQGIINRFTGDFSIAGGATLTCAGYIFHPNTGYAQSFAQTGSAVATTPNLQSDFNLTPGYNFLNTTSRKVRGIAASIRFSLPSLTFSTISGEVAVGVISTDVLTSGNFTGDNLFQYAAARAPVARGVQELRWYPGAFDNRYSTWQPNGTLISQTGSDLNDTNLMYVVYRGIPVNTSVSLKVDWVCEWVPRTNSGFTPTYQTSSGVPHIKTVEAMHKHKPGWFHNLTGEVEAGAAALGIGGLAAKFMKSAKSFESRVATTPIIEEMEEVAPLLLMGA